MAIHNDQKVFSSISVQHTVKPIQSSSDGCSYVPPKHLNINPYMVQEPKSIPSSALQSRTANAWKVLPIFHIISWHPSKQ